ncbi:galactose mutarotase-like protein [Dacryopinax primogenitus]|uniref:Galactose mutarotase-like protein n=1 Tax=Dacryopinax primogenitus (strain DJM 731) TaxID=1858805 RepID=M5FT47_DACPD|nr:galactose mutarotase-like protein [Dacryopinax primogenitus]EJU00741.1 galactose mutarotase-like protein [Dacryopinax primogenitus]
MAVPAIALEVLPYGLHITKILLNADGRSNDVIIAPFSARELVSDRRMMNSVVGRYTNRLPVGKYEIEKGGVTATVTPIANSRLPHVSLHSGPEGFDRKNWTRVATNKAKNFSSAEKVLLGKLDDESVAIFSLISEDGDAGFPGTLYTEVAFAVLPVPEEKIRKTGDIELGSLAIVYRARLLPGGATITPINLTHHWGFNFSASLDPKTEPDANQHWLRADSSKRLELGPDLMPTGEYSQNELDTEWDWKSGKLIGEKPLPRLDGFLVFDRPRAEQQPVHVPLSQWENGNLLQEALDEKREKAYVPIELYEEASGVRAEFITNQPGVQLYGGEGLQGQGTKKAIHGGKADGSGYTGRPGVFLEFHEPVNALFSEFGKEEGADTILSSGEMYNNYVNVVFCYQPRP